MTSLSNVKRHQGLSFDFLAGDGEVRGLLRNGPLTTIPFGTPDTWPQTLRNMVSLILDSKFPMYVLWGNEHYCLYNDAYIPIMGERHPGSYGLPFKEIFPEIWEDCSPLVERAFAGESVFIEDFPLVIVRQGRPEQTYFTFSYSPIRDQAGIVVGTYCVCVETTAKVLTERRQAFNLQLADQLRGLTAPSEVMAKAAEILGREMQVSRVLFADIDARTGARIYHSNYTDGSVQPITGPWLPNAFGKERTRRLKTGITQVVEDVSQDPSTNTPAALQNFDANHIRSDIAVPVLRQGLLTGALIVNDSRPRKWTRNEIALVEEVAERTWNAVERGRAEEALRKQRVAENERLRSIFEQAPGFVALVTEPNHVFELVNAAYYQLIGHREIIGKPVQEALPEVAGQGFFEMLDTVYTTGEAVAGRGLTLRVQRNPAAEPEVRHVDFVYQPVRNADGAVYGVFVQGIDVTERIQAEQAVRQANETLEERVATRTAELEHAYEQLHQAQKMEAVGQLTGGLAHDFNNMLAGITASLELLQIRLQQGRTQDVARYIEGALDASNRAAALTHRLLAFSRRQTLDPKPTNINQLVSSMEDLLRRTLGPGISFRMALGSEPWTALCDASQLENALLNLAINSRDAMPEGGRLTIETANVTLDERFTAGVRDLEPGEYIRICVSDTGGGMMPEVLARAVDPFFTTKPAGQDTGLGLSMIYGFVKQSRGHLSINSQPGAGTTVHLYLPRHRGAAEGDASPQNPAHAARADRRLTVLLVEDEKQVRQLGAEMLTELGYTVVEASDGGNGLEMLRAMPRIDLLITDVGLPHGMDGRQLASAAREIDPDLKVLFITGYAEDAAVRNGELDRGMQVLTKPFPMASFAHRVRTMLEPED